MPVYGPSSGSAGGPTTLSIAVTQSNSFSVGNAVYFDGTNWQLADASNSAKLGLGVIGPSPTSTSFNLFYSGPITGLSGLTAGQYYFVSDATPGLLTSVQPVTVTSFSNPLLFAETATTGIVLQFRPSSLSVGAPGTVIGQVMQWNGSSWVDVVRPWSLADPPSVAGTSPISDDEFDVVTATPYTPAAWAISTPYLVGAQVTNDTAPIKVYVCSTAGTSAGSGGPTGTTGNITDNTAHWSYLYSANGAVNSGVIGWQPNTVYAARAIVISGVNLYVCTSGGTSLAYTAWIKNTSYTGTTSYVTNTGATGGDGANLYQCATAGAHLSANTTGAGPFGTAAGITDGATSWNYVQNGTGPQGTGSSISDATVTWAYAGKLGGTINNWTITQDDTNGLYFNALSSSPIAIGTNKSTSDPTSLPTFPAWNYDYTSRRSRLRIQSSGGGAAIVQLTQAVRLPYSMFIWMRVSGATISAGTVETSRISVQDQLQAGAGQLVTVFAEAVGTTARISAGSPLNSQYILTTTGNANPVAYIGLMKVGTNYYGWYATEGGNWTLISATATAVTALMNLVTIQAFAAVSPSVCQNIIDLDFVRCTASVAPTLTIALP